jgi:glucuronokinase
MDSTKEMRISKFSRLLINSASCSILGPMIIQETAYARAGLVGNPSDIFNGKTISLLFDRFKATVTLYETPKLTVIPTERDILSFRGVEDLVTYRRKYGYYGGIRLIEAAIVQFRDYCSKNGIRLDGRNFTVEYHSDIPFGVGLGGSSAIIKAIFAAMMKFYELGEKDIPKAIQPNIILDAETEELGISAGPQDRVVVVYGGLVYMDFSKEVYAKNHDLHGDYAKLDPEILPPLFIVYNEELSKSSGAVHNIMRYRASVEHDDRVLDVMRQKAALVVEAREALEAGNPEALGPILSRDFDLRKSVYTIGPANMRLIEIARERGAHAKQTGSGGAAIGTYMDEGHYRELEQAFQQEGFTTLKVKIADYNS